MSKRLSRGQADTRALQKSRRSRKGGRLLELLVVLLVALALVFGFVRPFVVEAFYIPSESMAPTLEVGDRVLVNKFVYRFFEPQRDDVVVFRSTEDGDEDLIKRVVGLPGDHVAIYNGETFVNFKRLEEPYVDEGNLPENEPLAATTVPKGKVFVMGDNRTNSRDSRFFGPVSIESIKGEAFMTFWPLDRIRLL